MAAALDDFLRVISNAVNVDISILNFQCFYQVYFILEANFPTCLHRFTAGSFAGASEAAAGNRYQQLRGLKAGFGWGHILHYGMAITSVLGSL